jgi:hypothetical protein
MKVLILGLNHQIQRADILSAGYEIVKLEEGQKNKFGEALARIIQEHKVEFIGEEAQHGVDLVARRVATSLGRQHENIEMSLMRGGVETFLPTTAYLIAITLPNKKSHGTGNGSSLCSIKLSRMLAALTAS